MTNEFTYERIEVDATVDDINRGRWAALGYSEEDMSALAQEHNRPDAQCSEQAGQRIIDYCVHKGYTPPLTFYQWDNGYVYAKTARGALCVIIGSYHVYSNVSALGTNVGGFVLRGIVKRRKPGRWTYLPNGQASKNAVQVAHIGENDFVPFPEFAEIAKKWAEILNRK
jgi:hypothetical protein